MATFSAIYSIILEMVLVFIFQMIPMDCSPGGGGQEHCASVTDIGEITNAHVTIMYPYILQYCIISSFLPTL